VRLLGEPPVEGFVAAQGLEADASVEQPGPIEIYGESPARPVYSGVFEMTAERATSIAVSELRLAPESELKDVLDYLPGVNGAPESYDFSRPARSRGALSYAAAAVAACPHLCALVNLLPLERRASTSRLRYVPTVVLAVALLVCGVGLLFEGGFEDRRYLALVDAEIKKIEPKAGRVEAADRETQALLERIMILDEFRTRPRQDLDALLALTRTVPPSGYSSGLGMNRDAILIGGVADQAEGLVKALDASPFFESSEFAMPLTRNQAGLEMFRIRTVRTKGAHR
jgi:Tfp pilus assembly protein PilN